MAYAEMPAQRHLGFLDLPREMRDVIYQHYTQEKDGYHFDFESGKLRASASGQPIDLALMYTCKTVAAELRNLPLGTNRITFSTVYSERLRLRAGRFHKALITLANSQWWILSAITRPIARPFRVPELIAEIIQKFPQFEQDLLVSMEETLPVRLKNSFGGNSGQANSTHRPFIIYALKVFSTCTIRADVNPELLEPSSTGSTFSEFAANRQYAHQPSLARSPLLFTNPDPWTIAPEDVIAGLEEVLVDTELYDFDRLPDEQQPPERLSFWKRIKWRFSAAAAAIHFLSSIPSALRLQIRNLLLLEDHESVAHPECHALGLIPFCMENSRLHVERRVSLWRNVLPAGCGFDLWELMNDDPTDRFAPVRDALWSRTIGKIFSVWITEALALPAAGMPSNAFSLVFDGHPNLEQSSNVFEMVKLEAAFQDAADHQEKQWPETLLDEDIKCSIFARFETFPQTIKDIIEGTSNISCNFSTGDLWDVNEVLAERYPRSHDEWFDRWIEATQRVRTFQTAPPLPPWRELRLENVLPEVMSSTNALLFLANV